MKDNENDFMLRYDFEAGEREFQSGWTTLIVWKHKVQSIRIDWIMAFAVTLCMGTILVGLVFWASGASTARQADENSKASESVYGVSDSKVQGGDVFSTPYVMSVNYEGKQVDCKIPSRADLKSKTALSCVNGITINAK